MMSSILFFTFGILLFAASVLLYRSTKLQFFCYPAAIVSAILLIISILLSLPRDEAKGESFDTSELVGIEGEFKEIGWQEIVDGPDHFGSSMGDPVDIGRVVVEIDGGSIEEAFFSEGAAPLLMTADSAFIVQRREVFFVGSQDLEQ